MNKSALVIGGGAFGTSLACVTSHNFKTVYLQVRSLEQYDDILNHKNSRYLNGMILPKNIIPILNFDNLKFLDEIELIISGLPAKALNSYFSHHLEIIKPLLSRGAPLVSLSKGIDPETLDFPDDILEGIFPDYDESLCYLSGPSFAREIVEQQITMASLAGKNREVMEKVLEMVSTRYFKLLPTYDIKGVLLGGALKNILAIAGGIIEGLGYNHNTRAAMITRGIVEMLRFGKVFNARPETFYGLSGMGDLILTTTGNLSRNKNFGLEIAKGRKPLEIIDSVDHVIEGYKTTQAAFTLARKFKLKTRLFDGVYKILFDDVEPRAIVEELMSAQSKFE